MRHDTQVIDGPFTCKIFRLPALVSLLELGRLTAAFSSPLNDSFHICKLAGGCRRHHWHFRVNAWQDSASSQHAFSCCHYLQLFLYWERLQRLQRLQLNEATSSLYKHAVVKLGQHWFIWFPCTAHDQLENVKCFVGPFIMAIVSAIFMLVSGLRRVSTISRPLPQCVNTHGMYGNMSYVYVCMWCAVRNSMWPLHALVLERRCMRVCVGGGTASDGMYRLQGGFNTKAIQQVSPYAWSTQASLGKEEGFIFP